jgi:hypothetical protein
VAGGNNSSADDVSFVIRSLCQKLYSTPFQGTIHRRKGKTSCGYNFHVSN